MELSIPQPCLFNLIPNELTELILKFNWTGRVMGRFVCKHWRDLLPPTSPSLLTVLNGLSLDRQEFRSKLYEETRTVRPDVSPDLEHLFEEISDVATLQWLESVGCPRPVNYSTVIVRLGALDLARRYF